MSLAIMKNIQFIEVCFVLFYFIIILLGMTISGSWPLPCNNIHFLPIFPYKYMYISYSNWSSTSQVTDLAMTSSGMQGFLVSSSLDHTAKVFDLVTGRLIYNIISATGITSVACNSLGSQVFLGNSNGTVNIANLLPHPPPGDVQVRGCLHSGYLVIKEF